MVLSKNSYERQGLKESSVFWHPTRKFVRLQVLHLNTCRWLTNSSKVSDTFLGFPAPSSYSNDAWSSAGCCFRNGIWLGYGHCRRTQKRLSSPNNPDNGYKPTKLQRENTLSISRWPVLSFQAKNSLFIYSSHSFPTHSSFNLVVKPGATKSV